MLDSQISGPVALPPLITVGTDPLPDLQLPFQPRRPVVPRRPLRLSPPRDDSASDPRQPLVALNIFADIFDDTPPDPAMAAAPALDPRIAASRRRARRQLVAATSDLAPDEANFWHVWTLPPQQATPYHHASATFAANDAPALPMPLHEHLARVREALYDHPDDTAPAQTGPTLSPQMRLATHAMNATLVIVAFPVGAALTTYSLLRGSDIRISAQAMAIVGAIVGAWQSGIEKLL